MRWVEFQLRHDSNRFQALFGPDFPVLRVDNETLDDLRKDLETVLGRFLQDEYGHLEGTKV